MPTVIDVIHEKKANISLDSIDDEEPISLTLSMDGFKQALDDLYQR